VPTPPSALVARRRWYLLDVCVLCFECQEDLSSARVVADRLDETDTQQIQHRSGLQDPPLPRFPAREPVGEQVSGQMLW